MNALATAEVAEPSPAPENNIAEVAIRMADEGIPVRAIARSVRLPSEEVYEILTEAIGRGAIVELPKNDWPVGSSRQQRTVFAGTPFEDDEALQVALSRVFRATRLEAAIFAVLLKRNEVTKQQLHQVIEQMRPGEKREPTDPKMVDVVICHLRKKLKTPNITIKTVWSIGYLIPIADRHRAISMMLNYEQGAA